MNLIDVTREFQNDDDCLAYLESMRWPDGIRCPVCGCDQISKITRKTVSKNKRTRIYQCLEKTCKTQFSATNGTIFNDSHLPLTKWFMALAIIVDAKKGISANQLMKHLGIGSYRTAWYMAHRIRKAMEAGSFEKMSGTVEIDETYIGGKTYGKGKQGRSLKHKEIVIGIKERGGRVRFVHAKDASSAIISKVIKDNVHEDVDRVMTDDFPSYPKAMIMAGIHGSKHSRINHSTGVYAIGDIHTNGIESAFSLLKRGIVGSFHHLSIDHLHRYLSEFEYRFNERKNDERFNKTLCRMLGVDSMTYAELTAGE
jgi:transposase-like protein